MGARPRDPGQRCPHQMLKTDGTVTPTHTHTDTGTRRHKHIQGLHALVHTCVHTCAHSTCVCVHMIRVWALHACVRVLHTCVCVSTPVPAPVTCLPTPGVAWSCLLADAL